MIHLYHTNDLHSHFENWNTVAQYMQEEKNRRQQRGEAVFVLDIGDHVDRFHIISEATSGKGNVQLLNEAGYDFVTIGNNEGITLAKHELTNLYQEAHFDVLVANLFEPDGSRPSWAKPYELRHLDDGITIAFIGVTVQYDIFYSQLGWRIEDPMVILDHVLGEVQDKADIVVLLSHLGRTADEDIAKQFKGIDVIFGAHTHHFFESGMLVQDTLLCCTGKWGQHIGHVKLEVHPKTKCIVSKQARTIATQQLNGYKYDDGTLEVLQRQSEQLMEETVVELKEDLTVDWFAETPFSKMVASSLKEWCGAEIGMVNAGVLLDSLLKGPVTKADIHRICPHPINPCRLLVKGKALREVIIKARKREMEHMELKGFGFRGKVVGKMVFDGVEVIPDTIQGNKKLLEEVYINGEPLELERQYVLGTIDMFTFGYLYPELAVIKEKEYYLPELLRDILKGKLIELSTSVKS
ncbi:bifunctional metallophosphatase/5'-nucleotidase [Bacillus sp. 165]|nr:bifunctional metallophosphatase/5'-nucleotidase [Bacillus sp. 165]